MLSIVFACVVPTPRLGQDALESHPEHSGCVRIYAKMYTSIRDNAKPISHSDPARAA